MFDWRESCRRPRLCGVAAAIAPGVELLGSLHRSICSTRTVLHIAPAGDYQDPRSIEGHLPQRSAIVYCLVHQAIADSDSTLQAILQRAKRTSTPVRRSFLQTDLKTPSMLAPFVRNGRGLALELYLLILHTASGGDHGVSFGAAVWARALNIGTGRSAQARVYRNTQWLEEHRLVDIGREGRLTQITVLREDGSGEAYYHPGERQEGQARAEGKYLQLPIAFWRDRWHSRLDLPAKAALLIALSLQDDFYMLQEKGPEWYGISADTLGRGLLTLRNERLLKARRVRKAAPLAPKGFTTNLHYTLQAPFGPKGTPKRGASG